nr:glycerol-3-phosphate 1-O-acyltransferase PlsY [Pararobbsia alpina]
MLNVLIAVVGAYLIGSISFAVVVSKAMRLDDPRTYGSKNPGATNVLRSGSKTAAILTLLGDALKGWFAVWLVIQFSDRYQLGEEVIALGAIAVFLGHVFPVFFKFKGGKGVATAAGVLFALSWILGLATVATWVIIAFFFRYSSLAALAAAIFAPFYEFFMYGPGPISVAVVVIAMLLIWRHASNIARLMAGKESRLGQKKS